MTAAALVPTGRVTVCCGQHATGQHQRCCDPYDCAPCCAECPTCPEVQAGELALPGTGRRAARNDRAILHDFQLAWAREDLADALWWFDRFDPSRVIVHPPVQLIVASYRRVKPDVIEEPF